MANFELKSTGSGHRLTVSGDLTVAAAAGFRDHLLQLMEGDGPAEIDLQNITDLDLTALQLICAVHQSAIVRGRDLALYGFPGEPLIRLLAGAGFPRQAGCRRDLKNECFWRGSNNEQDHPDRG